MRFYFWAGMFLTFILASSCAGYKFRYKGNPSAQYHIHSVSIPMFFNRSSVPNVAGPVTKEFTLMLSEFPDLRIYPGQGKNSDAVLLGIIESRPSVKQALAPADWTAFDSVTPDSKKIPPTRRKFYIPKVTTVSLNLRLLLIKDPTHQEVELVLSPLGEYLYRNPKIIFNETIPLEGNFTREYPADAAKFQNPDAGGVVSYTKNRATIDKVVIDRAKEAARSFRENILYAF